VLYVDGVALLVVLQSHRREHRRTGGLEGDNPNQIGVHGRGALEEARVFLVVLFGGAVLVRGVGASTDAEFAPQLVDGLLRCEHVLGLEGGFFRRFRFLRGGGFGGRRGTRGLRRVLCGSFRRRRCWPFLHHGPRPPRYGREETHHHH